MIFTTKNITPSNSLFKERRKKDYSLSLSLTLSGLCWVKKNGIYTRHIYNNPPFSLNLKGTCQICKHFTCINIFFRQFLEHFVKEKGLDFLNMLPGGVIGVYIALYALVLFVVVLASILILTYYR